MKDHSPKQLLTRSSKSLFVKIASGWCDACGAIGPFTYAPIINETLARQWQLSTEQREAMSARESMYCAFCGCSYRLRLLARAINQFTQNDTSVSLLQHIKNGHYDKLSIAEINSCGVLHEILKDIPRLQYSEYGSKSKKVPDEDIEELSYSDSSFDLVLTSDTLEHVPNVLTALKETRRVLKPGGAHIMTVPLINGRSSKRRTHMESGKVVNDEEGSYHGSGEPDYLVWTEFGDDFIDIAKESGFEANYLFSNMLAINDLTGVVLAVNPGKGKDIHIPEYDTQEPLFNLDWQVSRVEGLTRKLELTQNHINNLETIILSAKDERSKLVSIINEKDAKLARITSNPAYRLAVKAKRIIPKL